MTDTILMTDIAAEPADLVKALTNTDGIAAFWTSRVDGGAAKGESMTLRFPDPGGLVTYDLQTTGVTDTGVTWSYVGGDNPSWDNTTMAFAAGPNPMGPGMMLRFTHGPFPDDFEMAPFITYIWAQILNRLKGYLEDGTNAPFFDPAAE